MKDQNDVQAKQTWMIKGHELPGAIGKASKDQKLFCRYLTQTMGNSPTNHSMFTQYPNLLKYNEVSGGSMMGSNVFHDTRVEHFGHK